MATLVGKTILIIGGSSGIGLGVALACLQSQAQKVIISSSSADNLTKAEAKLLESIPDAVKEGRLDKKVVNCTDLESVKAFMNEVGEIDHLVFTAGDQLRMTDFSTTPLESMKEAYDVRFWAALQAAQSAKMKAGGSITFTSGVVLRKPPKQWVFIAGPNGAIDASIRALAVELAPHTRVNAVCSGIVLTEVWDKGMLSMMENIGKQQTLVQHAAVPAELAEAYLFLMKCSYITGETLDVNGGYALL